jgi:hypothetical protein
MEEKVTIATLKVQYKAEMILKILKVIWLQTKNQEKISFGVL